MDQVEQGDAPGASCPPAGEDNVKTMSILAYIIFFVPLLMGAHKTSAAVRFHTNQGTILFLANGLLAIGIGIVSAILTGVVVAVGGYGAIMTITSIIGILWMVYGLGVMALYILGIVHAVKGELKPLPIIGGISLIK
ncbi:hypothetical protein AGMMS49546_38430 [Spirochaetia bacterium]|nr:hypothetical protein AGMMS49546_38430 [Spirochaetia bacterium]